MYRQSRTHHISNRMDAYTYFVPDVPPEVQADAGNTVSNYFSPYFKKQNSFKDQALHNRLTFELADKKGVSAMYYVTSLDLGTKDKLFKEDPTQEIKRVFESRIVGDGVMQPDILQYSRFGIQGMDQFSIYIHRNMFFENNYVNLQENGVEPDLSPAQHNPWISQRGYATFNYKGYSKDLIWPKSTDIIKMEFSDILYEVVDVNQTVPDKQFMQRQYWFKLNMRPWRDDSRDVSSDVATDTKNQGDFIDKKFNNSLVAALNVGSPTGPVKNDKDNVLYRPDNVDATAKGVTDQRNAGGNDIFGGW